MDFYQIVTFITGGHTCYCIWFSIEADAKEGLLSENGRLLVFVSNDQAKSFAACHDISLDESTFSYDVDSTERWASSNDDTVNCVDILNFWNIIQDICSSVVCTFLGNKRTKAIDNIYDKLFCGNNVLVDDEKDKYVPVWSAREVRLIKEIVTDGVQTLEKTMSPVNGSTANTAL